MPRNAASLEAFQLKSKPILKIHEVHLLDVDIPITLPTNYNNNDDHDSHDRDKHLLRFEDGLMKLYLLPLLSSADSWDYARQEGGLWGELCAGHFQSPIDIEPKNAERSGLQIRLSYAPWRLEDLEQARVEDGVPRIRFKPRSQVGKATKKGKETTPI